MRFNQPASVALLFVQPSWLWLKRSALALCVGWLCCAAWLLNAPVASAEALLTLDRDASGGVRVDLRDEASSPIPQAPLSVKHHLEHGTYKAVVNTPNAHAVADRSPMVMDKTGQLIGRVEALSDHELLVTVPNAVMVPTDKIPVYASAVHLKKVGWQRSFRSKHASPGVAAAPTVRHSRFKSLSAPSVAHAGVTHKKPSAPKASLLHQAALPALAPIASVVHQTLADTRLASTLSPSAEPPLFHLMPVQPLMPVFLHLPESPILQRSFLKQYVQAGLESGQEASWLEAITMKGAERLVASLLALLLLLSGYVWRKPILNTLRSMDASTWPSLMRQWSVPVPRHGKLEATEAPVKLSVSPLVPAGQFVNPSVSPTSTPASAFKEVVAQQQAVDASADASVVVTAKPPVSLVSSLGLKEVSTFAESMQEVSPIVEASSGGLTESVFSTATVAPLSTSPASSVSQTIGTTQEPPASRVMQVQARPHPLVVATALATQRQKMNELVRSSAVQSTYTPLSVRGSVKRMANQRWHMGQAS
jgi:hypothetical protein